MFPAASPQNSGQPGCTPAERQRHTRLLESGGGLVDAYRHLHPATTAGAGAGAAGGVGTDAEGMTWRGTAGNQVAAMGRYYGKVREEEKRAGEGALVVDGAGGMGGSGGSGGGCHDNFNLSKQCTE